MYTVAILGASGAVGREMLRVLEQRQFPTKEVRLLASARSAGSRYPYRGGLLTVEAVTPESFDGVDLALFSAGASISKEWAPVAADRGAIVVDNTSAFRMDEDVPLVVPECNAHAIAKVPSRRIIANPNCSTIQMVQVLKPLHEKFGLKRIVVATYQSVSGSGTEAMEELRDQSISILEGDPNFDIKVYPHQIAFNCLPHIDVFQENGYTKEEMKMVNETRKILEAPEIMVSATCVRVPVFRGHSESVNCEFGKPVTPAQVRELIAQIPNCVVVDDPANNQYPSQIYSEGRDETYVGRVRQDISKPEGTAIDMWVVSDNLRKGAALNAVQIGETLAKTGLLSA
ncbi:aspartate-semialdehyde dehydrogenase [bacterium]|nr:aspartate-semialdehyde dehydrogenase [bacterium]